MNSIFSYYDYRAFLKEYYHTQKSSTTFFSYRYFSKKAGIKSPVFLKEVYDGKKNLSDAMIEKFVDVLKLSSKEAKYFRMLVHFNQAQTSQEKQEHYILLKLLLKGVDQHQLHTESFSFYENWYTPVIWELVAHDKYNNDLISLAKRVHPEISVQEAHDSLQLLKKMELIERDENGNYCQTEKDLSTGSSVSSEVIRNHNKKMLELAYKSVDEVATDERFCKGITMGINKSCYDLIIAEVEVFKERVLAIVNNQNAVDSVYELYLQLFPLTKVLEEKER